ncbi:MAG: ABC transporter permease [Chromatiales bacterium]|nr:ABC transporter permease [Chromatiales bacterium]
MMLGFDISYFEAKYRASEAVCQIIGPATPQGFADYCPRFVQGTFTTVEILVLCCLIGLVVAVPMALARVSSNKWLSVPAYVYIYVFRGTPLLVQLFLFYYGLGQFEVLRESFLWPVLRDGWWMGVIVLSINTSAYVAEILRGGIKGVPEGQVEAGRAAGMSGMLLYRRIILPQAFRIAWPAYGNEVILMLKASALTSAITVMDLMGQTRTIFSRSYDLEIFVYAAVLYFVMAFMLTYLFRLVERRLKRHIAYP